MCVVDLSNIGEYQLTPGNKSYFNFYLHHLYSFGWTTVLIYIFPLKVLFCWDFVQHGEYEITPRENLTPFCFASSVFIWGGRDNQSVTFYIAIRGCFSLCGICPTWGTTRSSPAINLISLSICIVCVHLGGPACYFLHSHWRLYSVGILSNLGSMRSPHAINVISIPICTICIHTGDQRVIRAYFLLVLPLLSFVNRRKIGKIRKD